MPLSFEHEKSKNNVNLTKVRSWLTEIDCLFLGSLIISLLRNRPLFEKAVIISEVCCTELISGAREVLGIAEQVQIAR